MVNYLFSAYFWRPIFVTIAVVKVPDFHTWSIVLINKLEEFDDKYFYVPKRHFGRHIVTALSIRQSVRPSRFVSGAYLLYSLR